MYIYTHYIYIYCRHKYQLLCQCVENNLNEIFNNDKTTQQCQEQQFICRCALSTHIVYIDFAPNKPRGMIYTYINIYVCIQPPSRQYSTKEDIENPFFFS